MKAAFHERQGGLDVLEYGEVPDPDPGPNDVLIRVHATSLDRVDIYAREGSHGMELGSQRHIGGRDIAGVVEAAGSAVRDLEPGQAVVASGAAAHAELALAPSVLTFPIPEGCSFDQAGATPTAGRSAHASLIAKARIEPGETVLAIAAGSGVGSFAVQIAKAAGCRVIATAGSREKCEQALALGADAAIHHYEEDIAARVRELTGGRGVDVVADHVGAAVWPAAMRSLAPEGRFVTCGVTSGHRAEIHLGRLFVQGHHLMGVGRPSPAEIRVTMLGLLRMIEQGSVTPVVHATYPLSAIAEAHAQMERSDFFGKIVLNP